MLQAKAPLAAPRVSSARCDAAGVGATHRRATGPAAASAWSGLPVCLRDRTWAASTSAAVGAPAVTWPCPRQQISRHGPFSGSTLVVRSLAAALAASGDASSGRNVVVPPSAYQSLSLLFLLHENLKRAHGRSLTDCPEGDPMLDLGTKLDSLKCCVVLLAPPPPAQLKQQPGTGGRGQDAGLMVQYLNRAAAEALKALQHPSMAGVTAASSAGGSAAAAPVPRSVPGPVLEDEDGSVAAMLQQLMDSSGAPRRGTLLCLTLRAADQHVGGHASPEPSTITCPEALVLPLMSPNGTCAGVALLFDRWEVRAMAHQPGPGPAGRVVLEGRPLVPEIPPGAQPSPQAVAVLQNLVRSQADAVRALKTQQGLPNQDPRVLAAVGTLQQLKAELELQQQLMEAFATETEADSGRGVVAQLLAGGDA
ncbi:hypothetical protein HYH02_013018 [Chlamydomonas schloesseri]|uniref:Uncharacterized protein n=1 Tax=Chlamydomonas schloesseri TaxID=2026947 RepID=A0A835VY77_9CHLO|nr:hypothetical protein HYH02_013018 [Chlamydomonas schloesseri]|eukprot:KAG2432295.1 hypothetical protein HYH02_013018 [Chlamydomonas schloesseri]